MTPTTTSRTARPAPHLACCLCAKPVPKASDVYALDAEWQRRFPGMVGMLACTTCAVLTNEWTRRTSGGQYVPGHLPAAGRSEEQDFDSWCHIRAHGTHIGMVRSYPSSALQQGAEEYLRWLAMRPTNSRVVAAALTDLQALLQRWDDRDSERADTVMPAPGDIYVARY